MLKNVVIFSFTGLYYPSHRRVWILRSSGLQIDAYDAKKGELLTKKTCVVFIFYNVVNSI